MQFAVRKFWNWKEETSLFWPENSVIYSGPGLAGKLCYPFWAWAGRIISLSFLGLGWPQNSVILSGPGRKMLLHFLGLGWPENSVIFSGPGLAAKFRYPFWAWAGRKIVLFFLGLGSPENVFILSGQIGWPENSVSFLGLSWSENSVILSGPGLTGKFRNPLWA